MTYVKVGLERPTTRYDYDTFAGDLKALPEHLALGEVAAGRERAS